VVPRDSIFSAWLQVRARDRGACARDECGRRVHERAREMNAAARESKRTGGVARGIRVHLDPMMPRTSSFEKMGSMPRTSGILGMEGVPLDFIFYACITNADYQCYKRETDLIVYYGH
jgi:hypothetical protein